MGFEIFLKKMVRKFRAEVFFAFSHFVRQKKRQDFRSCLKFLRLVEFVLQACRFIGPERFQYLVPDKAPNEADAPE